MDRTKKLVTDHPAIFSFALSILMLLIWSISFDDNPLGGIDMLIAHILSSALCFILICILNLLPIVGLARRGLKYGLLLGIPFYMVGIASALISNGEVNFTELSFNGFPSLVLFTANMLLVGVAEELVFRGIILNLFLVKWDADKNRNAKAIVVSAVIFGVIHLANMLYLPPSTVIVQTINAASAGVLFSAIYIKSKNLYSVIIIHWIVDWLALFLQQCFTGGTSIITIEMDVLSAILIIAAGSLPVILISAMYLRFRSK